MAKLTKELLVTLQVLKQKGQPNRAIGKTLGVTEGAIRYRVKRMASNKTDGRKKLSLIEELELTHVVKHWWEDQAESLPNDRSPNMTELWSFLVDEYDYSGSYKSVRKYVREHFDALKQRPFRRIETPAAAQTQSDWCEVKVDLGGEDGIEKLYGFVMVLSHSRRTAVVWSKSMNQLAWHHVHNEAFKRLGGVAAMNRIDNLKTGVAHGAGPWGKLNEAYQGYARTMGFHIDPHEVRAPHQKGKTERQVSIVKQLGFHGTRFDSLEEFQTWTDAKLEKQSKQKLCPVTGDTVHETWQQEKSLLRPLPTLLPKPFDIICERPVHKDCTISFESRTYAVPFEYVNQKVEVRGCSGFIQVLDRQTGVLLIEYERGTKSRLLIDPSCYEGKSTDLVSRPTPLGKVSRKLQELANLPAPVRAIDTYAQMAEVLA